MLVQQPNAPTLTAAVQAASLLPVLFLSLPAGVLADVLDRRALLMTLSGVMAALCAALAALTAAGLTTPAVLIALTFLIGCGQALMSPGWQAIQPELVPREQIPAAAALGSLNVNVARAIGPAVAGLLVAATGPDVVFALNAVSFLGVLAALLGWHRARHGAGDRERMRPALASGTRYVRNAPGVRRVLLRSGLFVVPASALWGLLPVVAERRLGLGSGGYGLLLGALGAGAIVGAVTIGRVRERLGRNVLLAVSTVAFAAGTLAAAVLRQPVPVAVVLVVAGVGWLYALSTLNTTLQLALPGWVRARGLAVYLMVFMGGQGIGTLLWGLLADGIGTAETLLVSAGLLLASAASLTWLPLRERTGTPLAGTGAGPSRRSRRRPGPGRGRLRGAGGPGGAVPCGDGRGGRLPAAHRRPALEPLPGRGRPPPLGGGLRGRLLVRAPAPARRPPHRLRRGAADDRPRPGRGRARGTAPGSPGRRARSPVGRRALAGIRPGPQAGEGGHRASGARTAESEERRYEAERSRVRSRRLP
ncbi:MFS transporter [Streptomyces albidoflavus]|uniref:MFS transporter n=1 Tax=Streptomyces albidoflavus TaxID=1886 RepID=UPI003D9E76EB